MREAELYGLAKQHLGLLDESHDSAVPSLYLDQLRMHIGLCPNDINFRVTLSTKQGTGIIICMEKDCGGMMVPGCGTPQHLDNVFRLYRRHGLGSPQHHKSREERLKTPLVNIATGVKDRRSILRREGSSLLKALDANTPLFLHTTLSNPSTSVAVNPPATHSTLKRISTLTRVTLHPRSSPTVPECAENGSSESEAGGSSSNIRGAIILNQGTTSATFPSKNDSPSDGAPPLLVNARKKIEATKNRIESARKVLAALRRTSKKTSVEMDRIADLERQMNLDHGLIHHFNSVIDSILSVDPFSSTHPGSSMGGHRLPPININNDNEAIDTGTHFVRLPSLRGRSSSLYGALGGTEDDHASTVSSYGIYEEFSYGNDVVDRSIQSSPSTSSYAYTHHEMEQQLEGYAPYAPDGTIEDASMALPTAHDYDYGHDYNIRCSDTYEAERAQPNDISKFLLMAGNAEQFDGNATVDEALVKLGLKTQYDPLPGMTVALMPHQTIGVAWMMDKEGNRLKGGALSDDMGLGKTVQMIALMTKNQSRDPSLKTNLIIAPAALLDQWKLEIELKTNQALSCLIYHGSSRTKKPDVLLKHDVVLTTYQTMASEWPDYEKEMKEEEKQRRRRKSQMTSLISEDSDDSVQYAAKKRKLKKGLLFEVEFYRIVLDEAQNIRNKRTRMSRAVTELQSTYRWCLTGTPIINSLSDVYPYLRFIRVPPWHDWSEFQGHIGRYEKKQPRKAVQRLQAVITSFLLRRMKDSMLDGKRLIELPDKNISLVRLEFSREEREVYKMVEVRSQAKFNKFLREGSVLKNYHRVLVLLLRLRQICAHPSLIAENGRAQILPGEREDGEEGNGDEIARACRLVSPQFVEKMKNKLKDAVLSRIKAEEESVEAAVEDDECPICFDLLTEAVITPCTHMFCRECIMDVLNTATADFPDDVKHKDQERPCPSCRSPISKAKLFRRSAFEAAIEEENAVSSGAKCKEDENDDMSSFIVPKDEGDDEKEDMLKPVKPVDNPIESDHQGMNEGEAGIIFGSNSSASSAKSTEIKPRFLPSAKMKYMMEALENIFKEKPDEKVLVISQWTSCLSLVSVYLTECGILHVKYQGDMKRSERDGAVKIFMSEDKARVMLMSLKCGGIGLNLTRANNVINLDLAWSQAIESQAFDRVHRLGQTRPVLVQRLVISNTVEDRVLELQLRKQSLADGSLGEGTGKKMKRLSVRELANLFGLDVHGRRNTNY